MKSKKIPISIIDTGRKGRTISQVILCFNSISKTAISKIDTGRKERIEGHSKDEFQNGKKNKDRETETTCPHNG